MPDAENEALRQQLTDWIGKDPIIDTILDCMEEEGVGPTFENASKIWLDFLATELDDGITKSTQSLVDREAVTTHV